MRKILIPCSIVAAMLSTACSNDNSGSTAAEPTDVFSGDETYIMVRLSDASSIQSRATTGDPGYEYGDKSEHDVQNAYFYFYDNNGVFVSEGSVWNGGDVTEKDKNIEFKGENVVVLKGLTHKNYPRYMVTVLNRPEDFQYGETLEEMEKKLASDVSVGHRDSEGKFVMSTTSWADQTSVQTGYEAGKKLYFVTEVKESNFLPEPITDDNSNYVTVYVERLAAKVALKINDLENKTTYTDDKGNSVPLYKVSATIAGEDNEAATGSDPAAETFYVRIDNWKLNATAKHSNIVKNIDEMWKTDGSGLGFNWNKKEDFRSFWGKSFNYGDESWNYPRTALKYDDNKDKYPLDYFNLKDGLLSIGGVSYCAENTNTAAIVNDNFPSCVTSVLVKATICDKTGKGLSLVRYNGVLFTQDQFLDYVLNVVKSKDQWNVWEKTGDNTYKQADKRYVELAHVADGDVNVVLNMPDGSKLYRLNRENGSYEEYNDYYKNAINSFLESACVGAIGYKEGMMYYNIPIEHLNNTKADDGIKEANYGVVRNHYYVVTINELNTIGKGIFDPDEVIVPSDGDNETYYVGANINILSWKIVDQTVDL